MYTCTFLLQLLLWRTQSGLLLSSESPQNMLFPAMKWIPGTTYKTFIHFPAKCLCSTPGPLQGSGLNASHGLYTSLSPFNDISSDLNTTCISDMQSSLQTQQRQSVACQDVSVRDRRPLMHIQKVIIKAHQELQFISGSEMQLNIFTASVCDGQ